MKILVCDDMDFNLVAAQNQLRGLGHEVITEADPDKAVDKIKRDLDPFDSLVMTDLYFGTTPAGLAIILQCLTHQIRVVMLTDADGHKDELVKMLATRIKIKDVKLIFAVSQYGAAEGTHCAGFTSDGQLVKNWATALQYSQY